MKAGDKIIITKYAASGKISVRTVKEPWGNGSLELEPLPTDFGSVHVHYGDYRATKDGAIDHVGAIFTKRKASLLKQLASLDAKRDKVIKAIEEAEL